MNKRKNAWLLVLMVLVLTTMTKDIQKTITVQGVIKPVQESELIIGLDLAHQNNLSSTELLNLTNVLNKEFGSVIPYSTAFTSANLEDPDVMVIIAPTVALTTSELSLMEDFVKQGRSILVASGYRNQTGDPANEILRPFGLSFNLTSTLIPESVRQGGQFNSYYYLARNFTTPLTPVSANITQLILPSALGISFNETKLETSESPSILFHKPLLLENLDASPSKNNTLASTLEFENGGRILAIGSANMFNNSFIEPLANATSFFFDNTAFIVNTIKWLGKSTGIMNFYDPWVDIDELTVDIGRIIRGNVTLVDAQNHSLSQIQISINLERTGTILESRAMRIDPTNSSKYSGWISTEGLSYGYCDIVFVANRVGYLPVELIAGRMYLNPPFPFPVFPELAMWGLFIATVILFVSTAFLIWRNIKTDT
ncbi:MAG: hypothetical protein ACFFFG_12485 [Candidatus Thorarchaeota archaeon]